MIPALLLACTTPDPTPVESAAVTTPTGATADTATAPTTTPVRGLVWITIDTTRADHLGAYGTLDLTPHLDAFADTARVYTQARSHAPWTKPSMATAFTSQLPDEHGFVQWEHDLPPDLPTVANVLQDAGWTTLATVAHYAFLPSMHRFDDGFDVFDQSAFDTRGLPEDFLTSAELTDAALGLLPAPDASEPWLLWVHYFDPHRTYLDHPDQDRGTSADAKYAEEVVFTDAQLGRLLDALEGRDEIAIVLHADHGEEFGDHGGDGHTSTLYDELVRVPLMIRAPGVLPGEDATPVGLIDVAPTLLELADVPAPDTFRGQSLLGPYTPGPLFTETRRLTLKVGVVREGYKLIAQPLQAATELYDLGADPLELDDLSGQDLPVQAELEALLLEHYPWLADDPPIP